jgi:hypothetical protein
MKRREERGERKYNHYVIIDKNNKNKNNIIMSFLFLYTI